MYGVSIKFLLRQTSKTVIKNSLPDYCVTEQVSVSAAVFFKATFVAYFLEILQQIVKLSKLSEFTLPKYNPKYNSRLSGQKFPLKAKTVSLEVSTESQDWQSRSFCSEIITEIFQIPEIGYNKLLIVALAKFNKLSIQKFQLKQNQI